MTPRDYARLHFDWYRDAVLQTVADEEPAVMAVWPVLVGMAKERSDATKNPTGLIEIGIPALARAAYTKPKAAERSVHLLVDAEMVTMSSGQRGLLLLELTQFTKWQTARKGKADQEQARRDKLIRTDASRENVASRGVSVGGSLVSFTETETKTKTEKKKTPMSAEADVQRVFDYWVKVEAGTGGKGSAAGARSPKLTKDRAAKIRARLAEGYAVDELMKAIAFFARDPHHAGTNDRSQRFTDLVTTMKSGAKVETGVEGYDARRSGVVGAGAGSGLDDLAKLGYV